MSHLRPTAIRQLVSARQRTPFSYCRLFHSTPSAAMAQPQPSKDWSATQYLKFGSQRTRAVHDLVAQLPFAPDRPPRRIVDLGCGPGNSTAVLAARFPDARLSGVDSSPDMLARARAGSGLTGVDFAQADLQTYDPPAEADLLFSNAVFQWLRHADRIPTILRLLQAQPSGGVFAFQVPDNHGEPSHRAMREVAAQEGAPWRQHFQRAYGGGDKDRPDLDPIETPGEIYNALIPHCASIDIWHTHYQHILGGPHDIVEWVKGTGLQPFVNALPEGEGDANVREAFLDAYEARLAELYPPLADGKVMLKYPRLFVVAVRK